MILKRKYYINKNGRLAHVLVNKIGYESAKIPRTPKDIHGFVVGKPFDLLPSFVGKSLLLSSISQLSVHSHVWLIDIWRSYWSSGDVFFEDSWVSSANSFLVQLSISGRSLMYTRNNIGPSTLPCGTPNRTGSGSDEVPLIGRI